MSVSDSYALDNIIANLTILARVVFRGEPSEIQPTLLRSLHFTPYLSTFHKARGTVYVGAEHSTILIYLQTIRARRYIFL